MVRASVCPWQARDHVHKAIAQDRKSPQSQARGWKHHSHRLGYGEASQPIAPPSSGTLLTETHDMRLSGQAQAPRAQHHAYACISDCLEQVLDCTHDIAHKPHANTMLAPCCHEPARGRLLTNERRLPIGASKEDHDRNRTWPSQWIMLPGASRLSDCLREDLDSA